VRKKLGECLTQAGLITEDDLRAALAEHRRTGERIGAVLVRMNLATERQIAKALAYQLGFPYQNLSEHPPDTAAVVLIPREVVLKRLCIAVALEKNLLTVAMADPLLFSLVQDLEFQTGYRIRQVVATRADILEAIGGGYPDKALARPLHVSHVPVPQPPPLSGGTSAERRLMRRPGDEGALDGLHAGSEAAPIIDLVDLVIKSAVKSGASDIHIEPLERGVLIRHRLRRMIAQGVSEDALREAAQGTGMITLGEDALAKVKSGVTTPEELLRVITEVREVRSACHGCGAAVSADFLACPSCGQRLSGGCPGCGRAMQHGWSFCPYCARSHAPRRERRLREASRERRDLPAANVAEFKKGQI
jgi:RNA polymerase subunit RPABC4/transcription elongation factor Spt4